MKTIEKIEGGVSLLEALKKQSEVRFSFTIDAVEADKNGKKIAVLLLDTPIDRVRGTQKIDVNGLPTQLVVRDVQEVKVHEDQMDDEGFSFDLEEGTGVYVGSNLLLDVAKGSGDVWLVKTPFSVSVSNFRAARNMERNAGLQQKLGLIQAGAAAN